MDNWNRKCIDLERARSERSHPSPPDESNYYKNRKTVPSPAQDVEYPKYKPDL